METVIRTWRKEDFAAVRRILWESWMATYRPFIPEADLRSHFDATYRIDALARLHDDPAIGGFIGEASGQACGYAQTQLNRSENRLYLASLYVLPAFQGRGIGGGLLRAALEKARACGLQALWVGVMAPNEAAGRWYERRGFCFVREEPFRMGQTTVLHRIGWIRITGDGRDGNPGGPVPGGRTGDRPESPDPPDPPDPAMGPLHDRPAGGEAREGSLERRCFAVYSGGPGDRPLADLSAALLESQRASWGALAEGHAALEAAGMREIRGANWTVNVQYNPRRIVSSGARLDPESILQRPCFLCLAQLPPEQQAILYRDAFLIVCNPAPIYPGHLTIVHRSHLPQALPPERLGVVLQLAADFGPGMTVSYNGPRCGASAPDHLHFQAAPAGLLPAEREALAPRNRAETRMRGEVSLWCAKGLGRGILVIEGQGQEAVSRATGTVVSALGRLHPTDGEPMLNLFCTFTGQGWRLILFPRRKHRPDAYYRQAEDRLLVSPGAADMGGILVTPRERDFLAMDRELVLDIFREVALDDEAVRAVITLCDAGDE